MNDGQDVLVSDVYETVVLACRRICQDGLIKKRTELAHGWPDEVIDSLPCQLAMYLQEAKASLARLGVWHLANRFEECDVVTDGTVTKLDIAYGYVAGLAHGKRDLRLFVR